MFEKNQAFLKLEALEDRWVPTRVTWTGSTLLIYNGSAYGPQAPSITLSSAANNKVTVSYPGMSMTVGPVGSIVVNGGNNNTTYNANGLTGYTGSLTLLTGNGNDSIALMGTSNTGNYSIVAGNGNDTVSLAGTTAGSFQFTGGNGNNTFTMADGARVGGDLTISRANVVLGADTIGGSLNVSDTIFSYPTTVSIGAATIGKNLNVTTGFANSNVSLTGTTVNGHAGITVGSGTDTFATSGTVFIGSLDFNAGSGNDSVSLGASTTVTGDAHFTLGDGADIFNSAANFSGNFVTNFGNGSDTLAIGGSIGGTAFITLGDGAVDNTTLTGSFTNLNYRSGNGNDSLTIAPPNPTFYNNVNVLFGNFGGTLSLSANDFINYLSLNNTGSASDVYNQNGATVSSSSIQ